MSAVIFSVTNGMRSSAIPMFRSVSGLPLTSMPVSSMSTLMAMFPFFLLLNAAVIIITYFPEIVLVLPRLAFPS